MAVDGDEAHGFLLREVAVDAEDADGEEAGFVGQGRGRAAVDVDGPVGREAV